VRGEGRKDTRASRWLNREWHAEGGKQRVASREWQAESGKQRSDAHGAQTSRDGKQRVASRDLRAPSGKQRVASREWQVESCRSGVARFASASGTKQNH
jgi:hypothetical protein